MSVGVYDIEADWRVRGRASWPQLILCLYTGRSHPRFCAPMPRDPAPATGMRFGPDALQHYRAALAVNPAVHDGAILVGRRDVGDQYRIEAWSLRLFPPQQASGTEPNRGSAFNSCLEMSCVATVDRLYLISEGRLLRFAAGHWSAIA